MKHQPRETLGSIGEIDIKSLITPFSNLITIVISITKEKTLYEGHLIWVRKEGVRECGRGDHLKK